MAELEINRNVRNRRILSTQRVNAFDLKAKEPPAGVDANFLACPVVKTKSLLAYWPADEPGEDMDLRRYKVANYNFRLFQQGQSADPMQQGMYLIAHLICLFPNTKPQIEEALGAEGFEIVWVEIPNEDVEEDDLEGEEIDPRVTAIRAAMTVIYLNKNISSSNYEVFTEKRIRALCSKNTLSVDSATRIKMFSSHETAARFRNTLGGSTKLRRLMLNIVMNNAARDGAMGVAMGYTYNILGWTEMNSIVFICETLIIPRSPVIYRYEVAGEIRKLHSVLQKILNYDYPQFFRIQASEFEKSLLERNNYKLLLQVAHIIQQRVKKTVGNFNVPAESSEIVGQMVIQHTNHFAIQKKRHANIAPTANFMSIHPVLDDDVMDMAFHDDE